MKRITIMIAVLMMLGSRGARAQQRFDASIFGGANFSQIDGDGAGSYSQLGLRGGVGTSFYFGWDITTCNAASC